jgi:AcrR family transcriptional regulator
MIAVRAYDAVAKDIRRQTILDAAATLYTKHQSLPTASAIAAASNLAKGTIYRYFDSREDIFTTLVLDWWSTALDELEKHLRVAGSAHEARQVFPAHFCRLIIERPLLMQLDAV